MPQTESRIWTALQEAEEAMHTEQIAERLGITRHTASKYLEILRAKNLVRCRKVGNAKLWRALPVTGERAQPVAEEAPAETHPVFREIRPPLGDEEAVVEARRCLECGGPLTPAPCTTACPTHIDVPQFIREIREGRPLDSAGTIFASNVLGGTCARVCPVEELCEGACVLNKEGRRAIRIGQLQRFATDRALEREGQPQKSVQRAFQRRVRPRARTPASVAVVGAGPAGLACAAELARLGHRASIYERRPRSGGLVTSAIAPYKQLIDPIPAETRAIEGLGVELHFGTSVGRDLSFAQLERQHDAVFLGIGMGRDVQPGLPGEDLQGVWESLTFIERLKARHLDELDLGRRVAIVGGGNTAVDVAREAVRLGAEQVTVLYRRSEAQMPAYHHEVDAAKQEGVSFMWLTNPLRFLGDPQGQVRGVECVRMKLGAPDASGRPKPEPLPGTEWTLAADSVINAIGQRPWTELVSALDLGSERGRILVDEEYRTSRDGVFAGGDCTSGGATAVQSVRDGARAAWGIHRYLTGERLEEPSPEVPISLSEDGPVHRYFQGSSFVGTEQLFCKGCELCINSCPQGILSLDGAEKIQVDDVSRCFFCGICEERCPDFAIWVDKGQRDRIPGEREVMAS